MKRLQNCAQKVCQCRILYYANSSVLHLTPKDQLALRCKIAALIKSEQYQEASKALNNASSTMPDFQAKLEEAYCLYRTDHFEEANKLADQDGSRSMRHVNAQVLYRMERYTESLEVLLEITKTVSTNDEELPDLAINLKAAEALIRQSKPRSSLQVSVPKVEGSYELALNSALNEAARGEMDKAKAELIKAEKLCRNTFETGNELEQELDGIKVQEAYVSQLCLEVEIAEKTYLDIIKSKSADPLVKAIASNNLVVLRESASLFDSAKKLQSASTKSLENRLLASQRHAVAINEAILLYHMHKYGPCQEAVKRLLTSSKDLGLYALSTAAYVKQKKAVKAIQELEEAAKENPSSVVIHLCLGQLRLQQGNVAAALADIESLFKKLTDEERYQPGLVGLASWLYEQDGKADQAAAILNKAADYWRSSENESMSLALQRQTAAAKLRAGEHKRAAQDYEAVVRADPLDYGAIAGLISAYARFDPASAEKYERSLPEIPKSAGKLDVDALEATVPGIKKRVFVEKATSTAPAKKKHRRAPLLPKNYDHEHPEKNKKPDPERWLPKRERSTFRMKGKKKAAMARGPQGSTAVEEPKAVAAAPAAQPAQTTPKSGGGGAANKKKKKKGNKW